MSAVAVSPEPNPPEEAFRLGTDREWTLALRDYLAESLMVREGEVITADIARERANNAAQVLADLVAPVRGP